VHFLSCSERTFHATKSALLVCSYCGLKGFDFGVLYPVYPTVVVVLAWVKVLFVSYYGLYCIVFPGFGPVSVLNGGCLISRIRVLLKFILTHSN
jgi:hypothetical protein